MVVWRVQRKICSVLIEVDVFVVRDCWRGKRWWDDALAVVGWKWMRGRKKKREADER